MPVVGGWNKPAKPSNHSDHVESLKKSYVPQGHQREMQASCLHASFAPTAPGNSGFEDIYANDICRTLSLIDFDTSEDVIAHLKGLSLGDDFWMYSFKVRAEPEIPV